METKTISPDPACVRRNEEFGISGCEMMRLPEAVDDCSARGEGSAACAPAVGKEGGPPTLGKPGQAVHAVLDSFEMAPGNERT